MTRVMGVIISIMSIFVAYEKPMIVVKRLCVILAGTALKMTFP